MRIPGRRPIVLAVVAALVMPATSAIATDGTDHGSLEERVVASDFFVSGIDGATLIGIPSCGTGTTVESKRYPEKYPATAYRTCAGEVKTPDGIELDTRVSFPCTPTPSTPTSPAQCLAGSDPLPMVVLLHSWGGNRNSVQGTYSDPKHPGNDPDSGLSPARFLAKGYATLVYTARGYQASCGPVDVAGDLNGAGGTDVPSAEEQACLQGHTHLAERAFEIADTQHLLGRLVDLKVADPNRLAATGGSYGGGQSWLLATAMPWDTPADGKHMIQLAAAAPFAGWTDLYGSLAPNGRATDNVDQSASHEKPFGVVKERTFNATYGARRPQPFIPDPIPGPGSLPSLVLSTLASGIRYNTTNPLELHSFIDGWAAVFNAGEPHASQEAVDLPSAFRGKSAYYPVADPNNDYLTQLAARRVRPVPIFAVQGWTDHFFPAVEALQMYRKLKAAHPGYPIKMLIGDVGHGAQAPDEQVHYSQDQAGDFIDTQLGVATDGVVPAAASFATVCGGTGPHVALTSDNWDALVQRAPRNFSSDSSDRPDELRHTDSWSSNLEEEMASDPSSAAGGSCIERPEGASASKALWRWDVDSDFTMLGLPRVTLPYEMEGQDATVIVKLWDVGPVGPDQKKVLVTRGVYRVSPPLGQTASSGLIDFQLFGNHWRFAEGHQIELEIGQRDFRFLRPDNFPSSIDYSDGVELSIPQAKAP